MTLFFKSMLNNKLLTILNELGLGENEAKVYLACLNLGPATILKIARSAEIKRTTVYSVIESLKQKGMVNIELKGFKQLYVAQDPTNLEQILERKRETLRDLMPEFSALFNLKGGESLVKYYEGVESVKNIYTRLLEKVRPHENYLVISDMDHWYKLDSVFFQKFIEKRAKLSINLRLLFLDSPLARQQKKIQESWGGKIKILPKDTAMTINVVCIPSMLVLHQVVPPITAIVIENRSIIKFMQEMFEIVWKATE